LFGELRVFAFARAKRKQRHRAAIVAVSDEFENGVDILVNDPDDRGRQWRWAIARPVSVSAVIATGYIKYNDFYRIVVNRSKIGCRQDASFVIVCCRQMRVQ
jgi:hypothetical protein